ncbi:MAG TPA: glycosyltransferase [Clostridia bacterium]|nr:glycosyltransferase [Clostridia bacterium]
MKITIVTAGSRGDVQPYVALGAGLRKAGFSVHMPAAEEFREIITENGLEYIQTNSVNPREFVNNLKMKSAAQSKNKLSFIRTVFKELEPLIKGVFNETWEACQGSNLIITTLGAMGASDSAEKLGIPCIHTMVLPVCPTSEFHSPFVPDFFNLAPYNKLTHELTEQIAWQPLRKELNIWRKDILGLKPQNFWGAYKKIYSSEAPVLCGFSPSIVPKPEDWPDSINITGYWFLDEPEGWKPPKDLEVFLSSGAPPVYIGFGSMVDKEPERITQIALEALRLSGQRGIISSGWNGLGSEKLPDSVLRVDSIPHAWLFKRMAAIVHHGGAGTTAAAVRSGVPSIVAPFFADQPFWAQRISELGAGPKSTAYSKLTPEKLADLIKIAVSDDSMKAKARQLGRTIELENGVQKAVDIVERHLSTSTFSNSSQVIK